MSDIVLDFSLRVFGVGLVFSLWGSGTGLGLSLGSAFFGGGGGVCIWFRL